MADPNKDRVNLTVNSETKAEWQNAVENSTEYSSLSDLIRTAVAHELSDLESAANAQRSRATAKSEDTEARADGLNEVTDALDSIETTLSGLDDRLTNVEQEVTATAQAELRNQVFEALPKYNAEGEMDGMPAEGIAEEIDADRDRVSQVLIKLEHQTSTVRETARIEGKQMFARMDE